MLIDGGVRLGGGPMRTMGSAQALTTERNRWGLTGAAQNFYASVATGSLASKSAVPNGYVIPYCWTLAPHSGGLASSGRITGTGTVSGPLIVSPLFALAAIAGAGAFSSDITGLLPGFADLAGSSSNSCDLKALGISAASLSGSGTSTSDIFAEYFASSDLSGSASVSTALLTLLILGSADVSGAGDTSANIKGALQVAADLSGSGVTTALLAAVILGYADLSGSGDLTFASDLVATLPAIAALSGSGTISPDLLLAILAVAGLTGSGNLTLASDIIGVRQATSDLSGVSNISNADVTANGHVGTTLAGVGSLNATSIADAFMYGNIIVAGELLTTSNVAQAVWTALAEGTFTYDQLLRIIAAAAAGKSTGGPGTPVFRNVADTQDQISGTATSAGDRTAVTYGS